MLFKQHEKYSSLNSTHYATLYPQNGDRIVAIEPVTSLHLCIAAVVRSFLKSFARVKCFRVFEARCVLTIRRFCVGLQHQRSFTARVPY